MGLASSSRGSSKSQLTSMTAVACWCCSARAWRAASRPIVSSEAGRSSVISLRSFTISSSICSTAAWPASSRAPGSSSRRADESRIRRTARACSVSSWSSRAQRLRSCSAASIVFWSRSSAIERAVATPVAALAAKASSIRWSSSRKRPGSPMRSSATTTPSGSPRKRRGAISARPLSFAPRSTPVNLPRSTSSEASRAGILETRYLRIQPAGDSGGRRYDQVLALAEQDDQSPGLDQRPAALDDRVQHPVEIGLASHGDRDVGGGLQPPDGAAHVVAVTSAVGDVANRRERHHPLVGCDR